MIGRGGITKEDKWKELGGWPPSLVSAPTISLTTSVSSIASDRCFGVDIDVDFGANRVLERPGRGVDQLPVRVDLRHLNLPRFGLI